jgi:predicted ATPase
LQVAADLLDHFEDGAFFVALAPVADATVVPATIAQTLEIGDQGGGDLIHTLRDYLRDKHMLLVLDNFEQVMGAAPVVAVLPRTRPHLDVFPRLQC